jgi:hypothetical protein
VFAGVDLIDKRHADNGFGPIGSVQSRRIGIRTGRDIRHGLHRNSAIQRSHLETKKASSGSLGTRTTPVVHRIEVLVR